MVKYLDCSGRYKLPRDLTNVTFPKRATDSELVDFYNKYSGSTIVLAKFTSRDIAERKCLELKQAMDRLAQPVQQKGNMAKKTSKTAKAAKAKTKKAAGKGNTRKFALLGHTLHKLVKENPRREGTFGAKTWDIIKNGMTYEAAIEAGARNKDIRHDINQNRLELRPPKGGGAATAAGNGKPKKAIKAKAAKKNGNGNGKAEEKAAA